MQQCLAANEVYLAAALRRLAGYLCPCSPKTLISTLVESHNHLTPSNEDFRERVEHAVDGLVVAGDLLELTNVSTIDESVRQTWVFAAPPAFVARPSGSVFLVGLHRLPEFDPEAPPDPFSVLGTVDGFRSGDAILNRDDFAAWLAGNEEELKKRVASWIPDELSVVDRETLLNEMATDCLSAMDAALAPDGVRIASATEEDNEDEGEEAPEVGEEHPSRMPQSGKLLDRLLYKGVLPRYAFPTDVATFSVFDQDRSTRYRPIMRFAPSQGLSIALSQYAPGKQVWISGKCYTSGAVYSPMADDRYAAWQNRRLYRECTECGFAETVAIDSGVTPGTKIDCRACAAESSYGPARFWLRPPGFAHPVDTEEVTSPDDMPDTSYATRAKLTMPTPPDEAKWSPVNDRVRLMADRQHLFVSNTGPGKEGYNYCTKCGRIEATTEAGTALLGPHAKPYPDEKEPSCSGNGMTRHLVLGTDFITDIALFSLRVAAPLKLKPGFYPTDVALHRQ
jgi:hypothetical protein